MAAAATDTFDVLLDIYVDTDCLDPKTEHIAVHLCMNLRSHAVVRNKSESLHSRELWPTHGFPKKQKQPAKNAEFFAHPLMMHNGKAAVAKWQPEGIADPAVTAASRKKAMKKTTRTSGGKRCGMPRMKRF